MKKLLLELLNDDSLALDDYVFSERAAGQLMSYLNEWQRWNTKINLTASSNEKSVVIKHIYESLQYTRAISSQGRLIDIGSGAGFPGIPIKVLVPELDIVLIESKRKRFNFLNTVIRSMGLKKIKCIHGRVENFKDFSGLYNFVVLRHVLQPKLSLPLGSGLLTDGGQLILQTSLETSFHSDFTNSISLFLIDEISFNRTGSSHSKLMVFKRKAD